MCEQGDEGDRGSDVDGDGDDDDDDDSDGGDSGDGGVAVGVDSFGGDRPRGDADEDDDGDVAGQPGVERVDFQAYLRELTTGWDSAKSLFEREMPDRSAAGSEAEHKRSAAAAATTAAADAAESASAASRSLAFTGTVVERSSRRNPVSVWLCLCVLGTARCCR
jgi:hypothetical protein